MRPDGVVDLDAKNFDARLTCLEANCVAENRQVRVEAQVTGSVPSGKELSFLVCSQGDDAWFINTSVDADQKGRWATSLSLGRPEPYERARQFRLCLYLLPRDSIEELKTTQLRHAGAGLKTTDLPREISEVHCAPATRPAGQ
jgi:hypothetical protein